MPPFPDIDRMMQQFEHEQQRRLADKADRVNEAAAFWRRSLDELADRHAEALTQVDIFAPDADAKADELKQKLTLGHRLLLQQSDARWSRDITNEALRVLHHNADDFRFRASG